MSKRFKLGKDFPRMLEGDIRTTAIIGHLETLRPFGFTVSLGKKGFHVKKVATAWCIFEFELSFPTLDAAIFFMDGYCFRLRLAHRHDKDMKASDLPKKETIH